MYPPRALGVLGQPLLNLSSAGCPRTAQMASDRITISAGGKDFVTSLSTLKSSGAGYFEALLGPTGRSMKGRKRARADDDEPPRELFVDRDPDLFADVLAFMRSGRIPAATRTDAARLEDLKDEAEFFAYDDLATACAEAVDALVAALEAMTPPAPVAKSLRCTNVPCNGTPLTVTVPKGQILFLASATIAGPGSTAHRYSKTDKQKEDETAVGSYLTFSGEQHEPDFQLMTGHPDLPNKVVLAHVAIDHFRTDGEHGLHVDFRQDLRICLSADSNINQEVNFTARGPADCCWSLAIWVGHADAIPGLTQRPAAPPTRAVPRSHRGEDDDSFTTVMLAAMLARRRSAARTRLATMSAIAHLAARR